MPRPSRVLLDARGQAGVLRIVLIVAAAGNAVLAALRFVEYLNTRRFEIGLNAGSDRRITAIPGELLRSFLSLLIETALWPLGAVLVILGALWSVRIARNAAVLGQRTVGSRLALGWAVAFTMAALNIRWPGFTTGNGDDFELTTGLARAMTLVSVVSVVGSLVLFVAVGRITRRQHDQVMVGSASVAAGVP